MFRKNLVLKLLRENFFYITENILSDLEMHFLAHFFDITKNDIYNEKKDEFYIYLIFSKKTKYLGHDI